MTTSTIFRAVGSAPRLARLVAAGLLCFAASLSHAAIASFSAVVSGTSQIVEIVNPAGPVVRVETSASGKGSPGPLAYFSGDIIDLATGQGAGSNRFVTDSGDELFGRFTVQMVPGANPSLFDLIGDVVFDGGTGVFRGATGNASFLGSGEFISPSEALTRFAFQGQVSAVPEPSSRALGALALAFFGLRFRYGRVRRPADWQDGRRIGLNEIRPPRDPLPGEVDGALRMGMFSGN